MPAFLTCDDRIDDDGDKIAQNGDDNASLGFHIARIYCEGTHTMVETSPTGCDAGTNPYNEGDPYTAFVTV